MVKCYINLASERYARNLFLSIRKSQTVQHLLMEKMTVFRGREQGTEGLRGVCAFQKFIYIVY